MLFRSYAVLRTVNKNLYLPKLLESDHLLLSCWEFITGVELCAGGSNWNCWNVTMPSWRQSIRRLRSSVFREMLWYKYVRRHSNSCHHMFHCLYSSTVSSALLDCIACTLSKDATYCYWCTVVCVCMSVCLLDISMSCAKMAELIEMQFTLWTPVKRNHVLDRGLDPHGMGKFLPRPLWCGLCQNLFDHLLSGDYIPKDLKVCW